MLICLRILYSFLILQNYCCWLPITRFENSFLGCFKYDFFPHLFYAGGMGNEGGESPLFKTGFDRYKFNGCLWTLNSAEFNQQTWLSYCPLVDVYLRADRTNWFFSQNSGLASEAIVSVSWLLCLSLLLLFNFNIFYSILIYHGRYVGMTFGFSIMLLSPAF